MLLCQAVIERHLFDDGLQTGCTHLDLAGLAVQRRVYPQAHLLDVLVGHSEHRRDHLDRERRGELLHGVELIAVDGVEVLVDRRGDHRFLGLHGPRREHLVQHASHVPVLRGIHELEELDVRWRSSGFHHGQIKAVGRRERLEILEGCRHVLVTGQRVEVALFVVVDRLFIAHPPVYLVRIVEELLRERIEYQARRRHVFPSRTRAVATTTNIATYCDPQVRIRWDTGAPGGRLAFVVKPAISADTKESRLW